VLKDILPLSKKIYLHAQSSAVNFYKQNGFSVIGDKFYEAGIEHYRMEFILYDKETGRDDEWAKRKPSS
jgi:predicted GNAT family N-acyltransferase